MKNTLLFLFLIFSSGAFSQTLYVPGGFSSSGIGNNTTNNNVGVGTSSPSSKLDVSDANTDLAILKLRNLAWACNQRASIEFWNGGNKNYPTSRIVSQMDGCGSDGEALVFETQTSGQTVPSSKLIIKNNGNIGIGSISPATKLTIGSITNGLLSTTGVALGIDQNSIEFLHSSFGSGYGAKLYGLDQGNGLTSFRLAVRGNSSSWTDALFVKAGDNGNGGGNLGYIGIGSTNPDARLTVMGQIHANEVKVDLNVPGPDYVFEKDYPLASLEDIKTYIDQNKHLPEVPSAKDMEKNGVKLGEMNMLLLKKIEELTLHLIELKKEVRELKENQQPKR